jgi:dihydropteroate synthase
VKSQNHINHTSKTINVRGSLIDLTYPKVMGILNVTPDSFFEGSRFTDETAILDQVEKMLTDGATFIDVGGYSSRPGAKDISEIEELSRSISAVKVIAKKFPEALISIDTFRSEVGRQAILEGACIINDISAGDLDENMFSTVADLKVPYVMMHMRGTPQTMKTLTAYENPVKEITAHLQYKISKLQLLGLTDIIVDPGFGFAKTADQGFHLLKHLEYFQVLGKPILAGLSRKSMIWKTLDTDAEHSLNGTTCLNTIAALKGAAILRVHDVKEAMDVIRLCSKMAGMEQ